MTTEKTTRYNIGKVAKLGDTAIANADRRTTYDTPTFPAVDKPEETGPIKSYDLDKAAPTHDYSALVS